MHRTQHRMAQVLVGIVVLYLVIYGIVALILQSHANHLVAQQLGVPHAFTLSVSAWPPGLALKGEQLAFTTELGESGAVEQAKITIPVFMPWIARTTLTNFTYANQFIRVQIADATSQTPLYARRVAQYHTKAHDLSIWPSAAPNQEPYSALRIGTITFDYQRRIGAHDKANPEEESTATLSPIILPSGAAGAEALTLEQLSLRTTAEPGLPRDMKDPIAMTAWQAQGGTLAIAPMTLDALGTSSTLAGPITLDENLVPSGKLTLTFTGLDKAYVALKDLHVVPQAQYEALGNLLQLMPQKGAAPFDFPISIRDHAVFFMDGAIFELNKLPWEVATTTLPTDATPQPELQLTPAPAPVPDSAPQAAPAPALPLTPRDPSLPVTPEGTSVKP